jgi:hypothetical protein
VSIPIPPLHRFTPELMLTRFTAAGLIDLPHSDAA